MMLLSDNARGLAIDLSLEIFLNRYDAGELRLAKLALYFIPLYPFPHTMCVSLFYVIDTGSILSNSVPAPLAE